MDRAPILSGTGPGLSEARDLLRQAESVVVLTGAGVSAESGVPTFRDAGGLWRSYRPEELATPDAFARDPLLVWEWYAWRRGLIAECEPNPGHVAIAEYALARPGRVRIATQNVDGLHTRAALDAAMGADPTPALALELHGAIGSDRCPRCGDRSEGSPDIDFGALETLPHCSACDVPLRPDVVWFGEALDGAVLEAAVDAAAGADVCIVAGTSSLVQPAASLPLATLRSGGAVIEVNPQETPLSPHADVCLSGPSGVLLPEVLVPGEASSQPGAS